MTWAGRRQSVILGVIALLVILILIPILKPVIAPTATCFDNNKNQGELGVDCSGPCQKICKDEAAKIAVLWVRSFEVADGVYSAVAYLSNPNATYEARNVSFVLKLFDDKNILLSENEGIINVPTASTFPVFVGGLTTGKLNVKQASFQLSGDLDWQRISKEIPKISVSSPIIAAEATPSVTVTIKNNSAKLLRNLPVTAIVYDLNGNAIAASRTVVDSLAKNEATDISFTWLSPFSSTVSRVEIYPDTTSQ